MATDTNIEQRVFDYYKNLLLNAEDYTMIKEAHCKEMKVQDILELKNDITDLDISCLFTNDLDFARDVIFEEKLSGGISADKTGVIVLRVLNRKFVIKTYDKPYRVLREAYVSTQINKVIGRGLIPNFVYMYGCVNMKYLFYEYVEDGYIFDDYDIESISNEDFVAIFLQILFALAVAQKHCGFIHNDLNGGNVLIVENPNATISYYIDNKIYTLTSGYVVKIIDYGNSYVELDYGSTHGRKPLGNPRSDFLKLLPFIYNNIRREKRAILFALYHSIFDGKFGTEFNDLFGMKNPYSFFAQRVSDSGIREEYIDIWNDIFEKYDETYMKHIVRVLNIEEIKIDEEDEF